MTYRITWALSVATFGFAFGYPEHELAGVSAAAGLVFLLVALASLCRATGGEH